MAANLWLIYALSASVLWGVGYALSERILKDTAITPAFLMTITEVITLPLYIGLTLYLTQMKPGIDALLSSKLILAMVVIHALTIVGGNFLILNAIVEKNATLATLIEISYPLFVAIFAFILFKDTQLTWWTGFGGLLIFAGIAVIFLKS